MRLTVDGERTLWAPGRRGLLRTGSVSGLSFAATAPTVESGQRKANRVPNARFAAVADWRPLELYSEEVAARRAFGRHLGGRCRITQWQLQAARVLLMLSRSDLAEFGSTWNEFESIDRPDSREIAEFVRCTEGLDGLITRALTSPRVFHLVLVDGASPVAVKLGAALRPTLPDPSAAPRK
jgi:hypothetical protein